MKKITFLFTLLLTCIMATAQTPSFDASKVYTIKADKGGRGYLAYHADYSNNGLGLAGVTLSGYVNNHKATTDDGVSINFSIYKSAKGRFYLYNLGAGKFINAADATTSTAQFSDNPTAFSCVFSKESGYTDNYVFTVVGRTANQYLCAACGYPSASASPVRFEGYEANADVMKIEEVAGETVSTETQSAIATAVTNLESQFVDVTLNSVYNGTIFATEQVEININADLGNLSSVFSPASRYGLTCTGVTTEVTSNPIPAGSVFTATYVDNASETLPFTVSTLTDGAFGEGMHWYTLVIRKEASSQKQVRYDEVANLNHNETTVDEMAPNHLFAFTGDAANGFKIYNYVAGSGKILWSADVVNNATLNFTDVATTDGNDWILTKNGTSGYVFRKDNTATGYINDVNNTIGYWDHSNGATDNGSSFHFTEVTGEDLTTLLANNAACIAYKGKDMWPSTSPKVNKLNNVLDILGLSTVSTSDYTDAVSAYNANKNETTAQAIVTGVNSTEARLESAVATIPNKVYRISNVKYGTYLSTKSDNKNIGYLVAASNKDLDQLWRFAYIDGNVSIYNVNQGKYLAAYQAGTYSNVALTTDAEGKGVYTISKYADNSIKFRAQLVGWDMHAESAGNINAWNDTDGDSKWTIAEVTTIELDLNEATTGDYWSSLYVPVAISAADATIYYPSVLNASGTSVKLATATEVPANTGIFVNSSSATATFNVLSSTTATTPGNLLSGILSGESQTATAADYVLGCKDGVVGLYHPTVGTALKANRAYLRKEMGANRLTFDFGEATGIQTIIGGGEQTGEIYDLSGRRVVNPTKGVYVKGGKTVIIK
ncbi:MAG: RICIN domain-containing protein [Prevotellamassilia sp.]|nr:RICIN domain-containing protein [Prevotellamassilia sp.]